jgi:hypothetical protein
MRDHRSDPAADARQPARPEPQGSSPTPARAPDVPGPDAPATGAGQADGEARTPDEYMETPGSHRRPDGTATDVGA